MEHQPDLFRERVHSIILTEASFGATDVPGSTDVPVGL